MTDLSYPGLDPDRREIAAVAEDYLAKHASDPLAGAGLGWFGIGIPEQDGGSGGEFADLAPIIEAAGATCAATAAVWTTGVLGRLLLDEPGPTAEQLLPRIATGELTAALALDGPPGGFTADDAGVSGELTVHGAADPAVLVVPVAGDGRPTLVVVPREAVELEALPSVDPSRHLHRVVLDAVSTADLPRLTAPAVHDRLRLYVGQACALDAAGAARRALAATIAYAAERHQFGRPIGSFQAYKHRCADAYQLLRLAQAGAFRAALSLDGSDGDPALIRAAVRRGIPDCTHICGDAVQLHGAIGFSWESGLHSWLKRARSAELIAGSATLPENL